MLTKRTNNDRRPEIFWLTIEDFRVNHRADSGEFLSQTDNLSASFFQVWCVKPDSIDAVLFCQPDGALVMKFLRDNGDMVLPKHFIGTYSAAIFLIPICISFDTAEKRRYATYLILNRRFSFEF